MKEYRNRRFTTLSQVRRGLVRVLNEFESNPDSMSASEFSKLCYAYQTLAGILKTEKDFQLEERLEELEKLIKDGSI